MEDPSTFSNVSTSVNQLLDIRDQLLNIQDRIKVVHPLVIALLFLIGILGNSLVFLTTLSSKTDRMGKRPINSILVLNLAAADVMYLLSSAPYEVISYSIPGWPYPAPMCPIFNFLKVWSMSAGIFTMCSLALVRFLCLLFPFRSQNTFVTASNKRPGIILACLLWIGGAVLSLPNLIYFVLDEKWDNVLECVWIDLSSRNCYWISLVVITYVIPFLLVTVLYVIIAVKVRFLMERRCAENNEQKNSRKLSWMVLWLILAFLICWFPSHFFTLVKASGSYGSPSNAVWKIILDIVGHTLSYAHACVNPIVYTFAAPGFRGGVSAVLQCSACFCCKKKAGPHRRSSVSAPLTKHVTLLSACDNEHLPRTVPKSASASVEMQRL